MSHELLTYGEIEVLTRPGTSDRVVADDNLRKKSYAKHGIRLGGPWMDVGGYIGTFALAVRQAGGTVVSFEPEPENAALVRKNLMVNAYPANVVQAAVVYQPAPGITAPLYLNDHRGNFAGNSLFPRWKRERPSVEVPLVDFGAAFEYTRDELRGDPSVKLDIEGAELEILENWEWPAPQLVFEYHFAVDPSLVRARAIVHHLELQGYRVRLSHKLGDGDTWQGQRMQTLQAWCLR